SFSLARCARFGGLPGFRDYWACVCWAANQEWRSGVFVCPKHSLRIFFGGGLEKAYLLSSEGFPPPPLSQRAARLGAMICDFRHTTTPCSCNRFRLMVTHCRVAPTMWARSACVNAAPMRVPSGTLIP